MDKRRVARTGRERRDANRAGGSADWPHLIARGGSAMAPGKRRRPNPGAEGADTAVRSEDVDAEDVARVTTAQHPPELPHQVLHDIFRAVLRADDGGIPAILAAGAVCRGWRAAAHDPALWSHAARTRFGLHDFPVDSPGNRDAVRRMVGARDFAFNYARARWWRAVNGVESYRVTLHPPRSSAEIREAMGVDGQFTKLDDGLPTPLTYYGEVSDDYGYVDGSDSEREYDELDPRGNRSHDQREDAGGDSDDDYISVPQNYEHASERYFERTDADQWDGPFELCKVAARGRGGVWRCEIDAREPGDVRVTDHALVLKLPSPSNLSVRRLCNYDVCRGDDDGSMYNGSRYIRVSIEARRVGEDPGDGYRHTLCHAWLKPEAGDVQVSGGDSGQRLSLVIDGFTHLLHRASPGRCFEVFGIPRLPNGSEARRALTGHEQRLQGLLDLDEEYAMFHSDNGNKSAHARHKYRARRGYRAENNGAHSPGAHFGVNFGRLGCPYQLIGIPRSTHGTGGLLQTLAGSSTTNFANPRRLTPDVLKDVADGFTASMHFMHSHETSVTDSPAIVMPRLPQPWHIDWHTDVLQFKVTGGAAAAAMSVLERVNEDDIFPKPGSDDAAAVRCHLVFTHRTGRAFVSSSVLSAASYERRKYPPGNSGNSSQGGYPPHGSRAGHYGITFAPTGDSLTKHFTYQVLPRRSHTWGNGGFGDYDPGDTVARPIRVRIFDCAVSVGHSVLITVPARALVDAHEAAERSVRHELEDFLLSDEGKTLVRERLPILQVVSLK